MLKKGDKFKFTCLGIREASSDFSLYNIKESTGESCSYYEEHQSTYLVKNVEYDAEVIGRIPAVERLMIITALKVNSIEDDSIKDRTMYKIEYRL